VKPQYLSDHSYLAAAVIGRYIDLGLELEQIQKITSDEQFNRKFYKGEAQIIVLDLPIGPAVFAAWKTS
jgi:hypothetical protein